MSDLSDRETAFLTMLAGLINDLDRRGLLDSSVYAKTFKTAAALEPDDGAVAYRFVAALLRDLRAKPKPDDETSE
jgi:hypothetical protein